MFIAPLLLVDIMGVYIYVAWKSEGEPRQKAIRSFTGILILVLGILIDGTLVADLVGFDTGIIGAILMIVGLGLYFITNYKEEL